MNTLTHLLAFDSSSALAIMGTSMPSSDVVEVLQLPRVAIPSAVPVWDDQLGRRVNGCVRGLLVLVAVSVGDLFGPLLAVPCRTRIARRDQP